jgi:hypothetical protein
METKINPQSYLFDVFLGMMRLIVSKSRWWASMLVCWVLSLFGFQVYCQVAKRTLAKEQCFAIAIMKPICLARACWSGLSRLWLSTWQNERDIQFAKFKRLDSSCD